MKAEIFKLPKCIMFGFEFEWEHGSISLYFLFWEIYVELK